MTSAFYFYISKNDAVVTRNGKLTKRNNNLDNGEIFLFWIYSIIWGIQWDIYNRHRIEEFKLDLEPPKEYRMHWWDVIESKVIVASPGIVPPVPIVSIFMLTI